MENIVDARSNVIAEIDRLSLLLGKVSDMPTNKFDKTIQAQIRKIDQLAQRIPEHIDSLKRYCFSQCSFVDISACHFRSRHKPLGYAGDYLLIDWVYTNKSDSPGIGKYLDRFAQRMPISQSVRNRKSFFVTLFRRIRETKERQFSVLNLASGSCRDLLEALASLDLPQKKISVTCVDLEPKARLYSQRLFAAFSGDARVRWHEEDVFHFLPDKQYDLVWAAGLFDYLRDSVAVSLIADMWDWTAPGGQITFGNVHPSNPDRELLEWLHDFHLIHREEDELRQLCIKAGIPDDLISIEKEPLGIFRFCIARKRGIENVETSWH